MGLISRLEMTDKIISERGSGRVEIARREGGRGRPTPGGGLDRLGTRKPGPRRRRPRPRQGRPRQWAAGHFRGGAPSGLRRVPPCEGFLGRREGGSPRERRASDTTSARQRERDHGPPTPSFHQTRTVGYGRKRRRLRGSRGPRSNDVAEKGPAAVERGGGDAGQTASRAGAGAAAWTTTEITRRRRATGPRAMAGAASRPQPVPSSSAGTGGSSDGGRKERIRI